MEASTALMVLTALAAYLCWFKIITRSMRCPSVWPLFGSLPALIRNWTRMHDWIADNLRACGGTYQTSICAIPFLARKQGLITVTCDPKNLKHILKLRFDNYPKGPTWQAAFHDLLGDGIFNSDGDTWLFQRKTAALEFSTRTLRQAMARWVSRFSRRLKTRARRLIFKTSCFGSPSTTYAAWLSGRTRRRCLQDFLKTTLPRRSTMRLKPRYND